MRAHENPALDMAICLARQNGLSLLVYHALSEDYSYSSDRFPPIAFILLSCRDSGTFSGNWQAAVSLLISIWQGMAIGDLLCGT